MATQYEILVKTLQFTDKITTSETILKPKRQIKNIRSKGSETTHHHREKQQSATTHKQKEPVIPKNQQKLEEKKTGTPQI